MDYSKCPMANAVIDAGTPIGPFEWWRHSVGQGGINLRPISPAACAAMAKIKPRLIRIFVQQHFDIYPRHDVFDWSRLDPYMDALASTGAKVLASITIKPGPLYPVVDQKIWRPNDVAEWQKVVAHLVKRYSVDKKIVTHWGIGNETNIGENGGCPYLITEPKDFNEYYAMTARPIMETFPQAKIGGPSAAGGRVPQIAGLVDYCGETGLPLDFISWNHYHNDPATHVDLVKFNSGIRRRTENPPELIVTEWNKWPSAWNNPPVSVEEQAFAPNRAVVAASILFSFLRSGVDWTFYYHLQDGAVYPKEFASFYADVPMMVKHWNEYPHRFGLFGANGEVRPQYFVYQMLSRMGCELLHLSGPEAELPLLAARDDQAISAMIINDGRSADRIVNCELRHLDRGPKTLTVYRIDEQRRWNSGTCELLPVERRNIDFPGDTFRMQIWAPRESVSMVHVE